MSHHDPEAGDEGEASDEESGGKAPPDPAFVEGSPNAETGGDGDSYEPVGDKTHDGGGS